MVVTLVIFVIGLVMLIILATKLEASKNSEMKQRSNFTIFFVTAFCLLSLALLFMTVVLRGLLLSRHKLLLQVAKMQQLETMRYERCKLVTVMSLITISFLLCAAYHYSRLYFHMDSFHQYIIIAVYRLPIDILPIVLMLVLHRSQFKRMSKGTEEVLESEESNQKLVFLASQPMTLPEMSSLGNSTSSIL